MPRNYIGRRGSRQYVNYSDEAVSQAVNDVKLGRKSMRMAALDHGIPLITLSNKLKGLHGKSVGGQKRLSTECELLLVSAINTLQEWRVPMTSLEIRMLVKNYLDRLHLPEDIFQGNMPGRDWLKSFMKRHRLTKRRADNCRSSRAKVSPATVNTYFDHLEKELEGIPASNIFNYDETNLSDDPGSLEVIVRRGLRRVERIVEHSKASTSVMFCGSADGKYLPPMIVYKCASGATYESWVTDGPLGAQYAATKKGWFDMATFSQWFSKVFLPVAKKLSGPIALIGDNLGCHFSPEVIDLCRKHDIKFITLPPNSTHLCQPFDVAVFRSLKRHWRKILYDWRKSSRRTGSIPKGQIPSLIKELCSKLEGEHLKSGFRATGIYPLDRQEVLNRLPGQGSAVSDVNVDIFNDSVLKMLQDHCQSAESSTSKPRRGRKITPGKQIVTLTTGDSNTVSSNACQYCEELYDELEGDDVWLQCDECGKWFHLQCSGVEYETNDYYEIDISLVQFSCSVHMM